MVAKLDHSTAAAQQNATSPPLKCPRCDSSNTKFCYYNNYSLAQPRHFCKSCKRYWTRGGTLRNVPVGGGCRKNKKAKKSHQSAVAAPSLPLPPVIHNPATELNSLIYGFPPMMNSSTVFFPKFELDAQLAGYEENFQSCLSAANLADLQKSAEAPADFLGGYNPLLNSQIPSSSSPMAAETYQPLLSYDDLNIGTENNTSNRSLNWQVKKNPLEATNSFAATGGNGVVSQSSYLYWNQAMSGGWPESSSSVAPLI